MLSWVAFLLLFIKMIALQRFFLKYISIFFNIRNLKLYSPGVAIRTSCTDCLKKILLHCVYCISVLCTGKDCNVWLHETEYLITWFYFFIIDWEGVEYNMIDTTSFMLGNLQSIFLPTNLQKQKDFISTKKT